MSMEMRAETSGLTRLCMDEKAFGGCKLQCGRRKRKERTTNGYIFILITYKIEDYIFIYISPIITLPN